ncbi:tetratricopeptide repeat protein [Parasphingorhabdus sp. DH2-15]|uniref:tetratricopeptide repeat protein n=1 Tax=Parasphingorhabdus sp. DH2-15 TaxID=3444112 RepID=UPI003F686899
MTETTDSQSGAKTKTPDGQSNLPKWILAGAGLVALVAVGISVTRADDTSSNINSASPSAAIAGQEAPTVTQVIAQLEEKLEQDPDDANGWQMLGWSYFETSRFGEAAMAMRRATSLDPKNAEYHSMLGEALVLASEEGDIPADARQAFAKALALDAKDPRARYFSAAAKDMDGQHQEAINDWFALLADTPADAPWAEDVRNVIRNVGKERNIDVETRLASAKFAPPAGALPSEGEALATAAIPGPSRDQMQAAAALPQGQQEEMIRGMVEGLAAKLEKNPADPDKWVMLMRSWTQLGETGKAQNALRDARTAFRNDAASLTTVEDAAKTLNIPGS